MSRSLHMRKLRAAASMAGEALRRNVPVQQVIDEKAREGVSRREFLRKSLLTSAAVAVPPTMWALGAKKAFAGSAPRIAIVGAGLAGLNAAYRLKQQGVTAEVYEASTRLGGRCWTNRTSFANGQTSEHGGEFVNSIDTELLSLVSELNLPLDDLFALETGNYLAVVDGQDVNMQQVAAAFSQIYHQVQQDVAAAGSDTFYYQYTARGQQLDDMSIVDWINIYVPGGMSSVLGQTIAVAWTSSLGTESSQMPALNMVYGLSTTSRSTFDPLGDTYDERYHIHGGNDQVVTGLANTVSSHIHTGMPLQSIVLNNNGTYTLGFSGAPNVTADYVILALPVATLRNVDMSCSGFRTLKKTGIAQLGVSTNSKLTMQFTNRVWTSEGSDGGVTSTAYHDVWDSSVGEAGTQGILTNFTGGNLGNSFGSYTTAQNVARMLPLINMDLPGVASAYTGAAALDYWPGRPWAKGSYSCYLVGQMTQFRGIFGEPEGNCFFAGEYTSLGFQQFLNGACETGHRAATQVLAKLGITA